MSLSKPKTEWWRGAVLYQIYPRSFMDSNADGVGDLPGITRKLEYVARLGAEAIWISPFFKSPMKDFGYDVSDYRDVDPLFGTIDDFKDLLDKAHALGLKVMIDQVWSHTSDQHDWFKESRQDKTNAKQDWYVWADPKPDGTAPNNWLSYFGGPAWTWDSRRGQYYLHHFLKEQPSLNFWNPAVRQAIKEISAFWLDMGVDGFRLDVAHTYVSDRRLRDNPARQSHEPLPTDIPASNPMSRQRRVHSMNVPENLEWIEEISAYVRRWPERCLLGETGGDNSEAEAVLYTKTDGRFQMAYSFGLVGTGMSRGQIEDVAQRTGTLLEDGGWVCWATSNHDFKRVGSRIAGNAPVSDKSRFATILGLCLRGSYCMYEGEELGLPQAELTFEDIQDPYDKMLYPNHVGRDGCRTPMPWEATGRNAGFSDIEGKPWLPVPEIHRGMAVDLQEKTPDSTLARIRAFLAWRGSIPALRIGAMDILDVKSPLFAIRRRHEDQSYLCIFNCADSDAVHARETDGACLLMEHSYNVRTDGEQLVLGPFGYAFLKES